MLHGVLFPDSPGDPPTYTNRHLATPLLTLTLLLLRSPIPSIALLISPLSSLHRIVVAIIQAFFLAVRARMGVLSVANTSVLWWGQGMGKEAEDEAEVDNMTLHDMNGAELQEEPVRLRRHDHRLLATCESGPPLEVRVPELETVGWDRLKDATGESLSNRRGRWELWKRYTLPRVQEDWMTAHPRVDPIDGSLLFYSTSMFDAPHARYSVIDRHGKHLVWKQGIDVGRAKMMHDFAATRTHTILLNLPLTLDPANIFSMPPMPLIHFDRSLPSEFVVFPRLLRSEATPQEPVRFVEPEPSLVFHTANAWDEYKDGELVAINMLGCRFKSAKLVYAAGQVEVPSIEKRAGEDDVVRLHYYRFLLPDGYTSNTHNTDQGAITHSFPVADIPFEFPTMPTDTGMSAARYVYGCTMQSGSFDERLGGAAKVDCLVKLDVLELARRGRERGEGKNMAPVDKRSAADIIAAGRVPGSEPGVIQIFALPPGFYAQEPRFVPRQGAVDEDDGFLLSYIYDEANLQIDGTPSTAEDAGSELWVIDAKRMAEGMPAVICRIKLPQRVPYGLHGTWLPRSWTRHQRPLAPLAPQALLQDKLAISRLQHFASIIFDRPTERDKSNFEKALLAVMWPAGVGVLGVAIGEVVNFQNFQRKLQEAAQARMSWVAGGNGTARQSQSAVHPTSDSNRPWPLVSLLQLVEVSTDEAQVIGACLMLLTIFIRSSPLAKRTSSPSVSG